ncbi:hypothetical protein ACOMHN_039396 [Nucella lapillus]
MCQSSRHKHMNGDAETFSWRTSEKSKLLLRKRERQRVLSIVEDLRPSTVEDLRSHQGPRSSPADINRLQEQYSTNPGLKKALWAEVLFQKLVLFKKSPLLKVTGTALTVVNKLLGLFEGPTLTTQPPLSGLIPCIENFLPTNGLTDQSILMSLILMQRVIRH